MQMGCYGIGVTRIVAAAIEQNHDERGIVWPAPLAPFQVVLVPLNWVKSERVRAAAEELYAALQAAGVEILRQTNLLSGAARRQRVGSFLHGDPQRTAVQPTRSSRTPRRASWSSRKAQAAASRPIHSGGTTPVGRNVPEASSRSAAVAV